MSINAAVRHPLGLPAGSVRGMLSLLIVIQFWMLLLLPDSSKVAIPINLYLLLTLVALFFVSHGKSIAAASEPSPSPLYLPGGTLRVVILGGTAAVIGYLYMNHYERLTERLQPAPGQLLFWPTIVGAYVGGFVIGYLLRSLPFRNNWGFQAFTAWLSIIAMFLLFAEIIVQAFIAPTLKDKIDLHAWEAIVTAVTAFYFGARS